MFAQCLHGARSRSLRPELSEAPERRNGWSAEADGNRTRLPALAGTPVLKFGDGRVTPCDLVVLCAPVSRPSRPFVTSGAALCWLVTSRAFAKCLHQGKHGPDDFWRRGQRL